jgi:hypothetical protein
VAILTWEPATRRWFGLRDKVIGWTPEQRAGRLKYCIENRRFLMLDEGKNLASMVLSRSVDRLKIDGEKVFGHDFMLAETFVDPSLGYEGTCYKAAGWSDAGLTQGGRGAQERSKKRYFLKELQVNAIDKLKSPELSPTDLANPRQKTLTLERLNLESLRKKLEAVPDHRKKCWYPLSSVLAMVIAAVLCGKTNAKEIYRWIAQLSRDVVKSLGCRQAPSYCMIWRTISLTDQAALTQALGSWLAEQTERLYVDRNLRLLSLDGKTLRTASKAAGVDLHVLSIIDTVAKVFLDQQLVGEKTNEIPVAQELLSKMELDAKTVITADALHTQKKTAEVILKKTPITSLPSKTTSQNSRQRFSKTPPKRLGQLRTILRSLDMAE